MEAVFDEDRIVAACQDHYDEFLEYLDEEREMPADVVSYNFIRYSSTVAVKFGWRIREREARNQAHAHRVLDPRFVRVPEVYHFFQRGRGHECIGYLVMEYIEGDRCENPPSSDNLPKIADALKHLSHCHGDHPGPVSGGLTYGVLFDEAWPELESVQDLEKYCNDRLWDGYGQLWNEEYWQRHRIKVEPLRFPKSDLVLTHGQIVPRHIMWCPDGTLALLDWSEAAFLPRCFEYVATEENYNCGDHGNHADYIALMKELLPLNEDEELRRHRVKKCMSNTFRFCLYPDQPENFFRRVQPLG